MFKLIARTAIAFLAATTIAHAAPSTQTGHVTFLDEVSGQILVDNQLVALAGDLSGAGLRLGDEVALVMNTDLAIALVEPMTTGAIAMPEAPATSASTEGAMGIVTFADEDAGILVLDNSIVLAAGGSSLSSLRLGQRVETRYSAIAGLKLAGAVTAIE